MRCRFCDSAALELMIDLGFAPPSNAYLGGVELSCPEIYYPLRVRVCICCWLVQTEDYANREQLFAPGYAYFSSTSSSWLEHAAAYCDHITNLLDLDASKRVVEIASNDGYLLRNFLAKGVPCLGIEPTRDTAAAARSIGVPVVEEFFGEELGRRLAASGMRADLVIGNNVYAHVPDIRDFTSGIKQLLAPSGVVTLEFPHLLQMHGQTQFDTIYHEHFSYLSLTTVNAIFSASELRVWDVECLATHGGSLRVYGCHADDFRQPSERVACMLEREVREGVRDLDVYRAFEQRALRIKDELLGFLLENKRQGRRVCGYGAAAKGSTLLNFAGIRGDLLGFVCDAAASKQGKYMPGSHIPILGPAALRESRPDIVLVLPWNLLDEIRESLQFIKGWGGRLAVAMPTMRLLD